jgi:hypothetical protein
VTPAMTGSPVRLRNCRGVLVDSNFLLDLAINDTKWSDRSGKALAECAEPTMVINPIIYAESSISYTTIEPVNAALFNSVFKRKAFPWEAGFLADKCFMAYRRRGGPRNAPLPDFNIAASHARCCSLSNVLPPKARSSRPQGAAVYRAAG